MNYTLAISEAAEEDVRNAFLWYEDKQQGLGMDFELLFNEAIDSIISNPLKIQIRYGKIRVFFLTRFPYGIHFIVTGNTILVVAVFATKDNPEKWTKRSK
jgi:plasmid stabilization system protein ParE